LSLSDAAFQIAAKYGCDVFGDTGEAIANAVRSNSIPLRGRAWDQQVFARIDGRIAPLAGVDCFLSHVVVGRTDYHNVQVEFEALEKYLRENLVLPGIELADPLSVSASNANSESIASEWLRSLPSYTPIMTKREFREAINSKDHPLYESCGEGRLSGRALEKVWSHAPEQWRRAGRRPTPRG
jgi:hypothetical protein